MGHVVILGLMGGVGSGKSTVARAFGSHGAHVLDADAIAHACLAESSIVDRIRDAFGDDVIVDGEVDRARLGAIVFDAPDRLAALNRIVHPAVRAEIHRRLEEIGRLDGPQVAVLDVPLLLESELNQLCHRRLFVDAPEAIRRERVVRDRGWAPDELERREKNQKPLADKRAAADYTVENAGDVDLISSRALTILGELLQTAAESDSGGTV